MKTIGIVKYYWRRRNLTKEKK